MVAGLMAVTAVVLGAPAAHASVAPRLPHSSWTVVGGGPATEVRSTMRITTEPEAAWWQRSPNVYWASSVFPSGSPSTAYFGLQKRTMTPEKTALFSWWDALDVSCTGVPNVVNCGRFTNEGTGFQALVGFDWQEGVDYTFRLWRGDGDPSRQAFWWHVEILDGAGVRLVPVGAILVPASSGGIVDVLQWTEWFAAGDDAADNCDQIPEAEAWFAAPVLDGVPATPAYLGVGEGQACPAQSAWSAGGARQRIGTATPTVAIAQDVGTTWMTPHPGFQGSGAWIAVAAEPAAPPGGLAPAYLYGHRFQFTGNSPAFATIGLVTVPAGKFAVFTVREEGGRSHDAVVAFDWKPGRFYFPLVHQLSPGVWGGWVFDHSASTWVPIGAFTLPAAWGQLSALSTTSASWLGPTASSCASFPQADVYFSRPTGYAAGGAVVEGKVVDHYRLGGTCASDSSTVSGTWARYRVTLTGG